MSNNRRDFLKKSTLLGLTGIATSIISKEKIQGLEAFSKQFEKSAFFTLPKLQYAYGALEPFIDKETMEIHYTKHHQAYVNKLNELNSADLDYTISIAAMCGQIDQKCLPALRNNLGGHYNHSLFWTLLKPNPQNVINEPIGKTAEAIINEFKSFDGFKKEFTEKATKIFGSGWCWLILQNNKLKIVTTANQDNPLMKVSVEQGKPVLALDVWEHAYYLKYQNKRVDYINNWWNIINWQKVEELFTTQ